MPDIFGRLPGDYVHLRDLEKIQAGAGRKRHDFEALNIGPQRRIDMADAAVLGYITNNLQAVQSQVEEVLYTDYRLDKLVPIFSDIAEGAQTYGYRVIDGVGDAGWIDNRGTNAGSARASQQFYAAPLRIGGVFAEWTREDLRASMMAGVALDDYTIKFATKSCMYFIEQVGIRGDTAMGTRGLVNQVTGTDGDEVRLNTLADNAGFDDLNGDEMAKLVTDVVSTLIVDSAEIIGRTITDGLTVYLPIREHNLIMTTRLTDSPTLTAWEWAKKNNQWTGITGKELEIQMLAELSGAGAVTGQDRMILALNTREIMEFAQPISPRVLEVLPQGFYYQVPLEFKIGPGLNLKRPVGMHYTDNIN